MCYAGLQLGVAGSRNHSLTGFLPSLFDIDPSWVPICELVKKFLTQEVSLNVVIALVVWFIVAYRHTDSYTNLRIPAKQLAALGIMTRLDRDALAMYAQAFATWRNAVLEMAKSGPVTKGKAGNLVKHPHFRIAETAYNQMRQMLAEFGMTPSSRTRISADGGDGEGWDDL